MKIAFGTVLDRPWGLTLGQVGLRKLSAQVTVRSDDGKTYTIAFADGRVIAAASPLPNDSVTRVALTSHFVSPTQVGEITKRLQGDWDRDEVEVVAEIGKLTPEHVGTLRRRLNLQRAARTFAVDRGQFEIEDQITMTVRGEVSIPLGAVIFHGVRMNLSEQRLIEDMRELGSSYLLKNTATPEDIGAYEFEGDIRSVIESLRKGTTLAELELASHRDIEPRTLHAMVYALVAGGHCDATGGQVVNRNAPPAPRTSTGPLVMQRTTIKTDQPLVARAKTTAPPINVPRTPTPPTVSRTITPLGDTTVRRATTPPAESRAPSQPKITRVVTNQGTFSDARPPANAPMRERAPSSSPDAEFVKEATTGSTLQQIVDEFKREPSTSRGNIVDEFKREPSTSRGIIAAASTIATPRTVTERDQRRKEIEIMVAQRLAKLDAGCDYFAILGLPFEAPLDVVRNSFVDMARRLNPESLAHCGITDENKAAARVFAQATAAYNVLNDTNKRRDYINSIRRGDPTPIAPRARADQALDKSELAAEAYEKGEGALKREDIGQALEELSRAVTLAPANLEYMAMFAWAQFCAATDKQKAYLDTRKALEKAIHRSEKPVVARFYLGRVERMVGHDREAMNHFQEVLLDDPNNKEAASEVRVLEQRMARGTKPKR